MKNTGNMRSKKEIGDVGEGIAVKYLLDRGHEIIARNYHSRYGEVDIIADFDEYIVFVEVKYRKSNLYGEPSLAVNYRKQEKIKKTALKYISDNEAGDKDIRFDIIEIIGVGEVKINHIENAFC